MSCGVNIEKIQKPTSSTNKSSESEIAATSSESINNNFYDAELLNDKSTLDRGNSNRSFGEMRTIEIFLKYFGDCSRFGDQLIVFGVDRVDSIIERAVLKRIDNEVPLLIFNYMKENLDKGFIITDKRMIFWFDSLNKVHSFPLRDIKTIESGKSVLANVMRLKTFSNRISSNIFLTGIDNHKEFLVVFKEFLFELNNPDEYANAMNELVQLKENISLSDHYLDPNDLDLSPILSVLCRSHSGEYQYSVIGAPISSAHRKYSIARKNFSIPQGSEIFIIYDETIFGGCTKGFIVCSTGIHFIKGSKQGIITWDNFWNMKVSSGFSELKLGEFGFTSSKKDILPVKSILEDLKDAIYDISK